MHTMIYRALGMCMLAGLVMMNTGCSKLRSSFTEAKAIQKLLTKRFPTIGKLNIRIKHSFMRGKQLQLGCIVDQLPSWKGFGAGSRAKWVSAYVIQNYPGKVRPKMVHFVVFKRRKKAGRFFMRRRGGMVQVYRYHTRLLMAFKRKSKRIGKKKPTHRAAQQPKTRTAQPTKRSAQPSTAAAPKAASKGTVTSKAQAPTSRPVQKPATR